MFDIDDDKLEKVLDVVLEKFFSEFEFMLRDLLERYR